MATTSSSLPSTMKAQFLDAFNTPYSYREVSLPTITSPDDLLIKVDAASFCHTDAVLAAGQLAPSPPSFPIIGCHEFVGTVVAVPDEQSAAAKPPISLKQFRPGDRVAVCTNKAGVCGTCEECQTDTGDSTTDPAGYSTFCPQGFSAGLSRDGGFAEYAIVDARQLVPVPEGMTAVETAPMMCAGITIYAAIKKCGLAKGQRIGIVGCGGGLGHLGLQFAVKMGLEVIGVDNADEPLALASGLNTGARIVDARKEDADDIVQQIGQQDGKQYRSAMGLDAVIILPESQKGFDYGVQLLKDHGKCVVVSFPKAGFHLSSYDLVFRDIAVVGSLFGSRRMAAETLEFAAAHGIKPITKTYPLSKLNDLVTEYNRGLGGKLAVDMSEES
jgi:D-arabinose 1-dehydrogenase-like Zn-dependent alcohol dehydrogenase